MDWHNEPWVRVYTRDTPDWLLLGWEARSLWLAMLRKFDRAGVIDLGRYGVRGLAAMVGMPVGVVEHALSELLADGCVELHDAGQPVTPDEDSGHSVTPRDQPIGQKLIAKNFLSAQSALASDRLRKQRSREQRRAMALAAPLVTRRDRPVSQFAVSGPENVASQRVNGSCSPIHRDTESQNVTSGHGASRNVHTRSHAVTLTLSDTDLTRSLVSAVAPTPPAAPARGRVRSRPKASQPTADEQAVAGRVLAKLNERSGRTYASEKHVQRIVRLLRAGHSERELRLVVWDRANRWAEDERMSEYLRPSTLFGPEKFPDYLAEALAAYEADKRAREEAGPPRNGAGPFDGLRERSQR
jgi:uncharacterized phage protein (TIGR02220 family)